MSTRPGGPSHFAKRTGDPPSFSLHQHHFHPPPPPTSPNYTTTPSHAPMSSHFHLPLHVRFTLQTPPLLPFLFKPCHPAPPSHFIPPLVNPAPSHSPFHTLYHSLLHLLPPHSLSNPPFSLYSPLRRTPSPVPRVYPPNSHIISLTPNLPLHPTPTRIPPPFFIPFAPPTIPPLQPASLAALIAALPYCPPSLLPLTPLSPYFLRLLLLISLIISPPHPSFTNVTPLVSATFLLFSLTLYHHASLILHQFFFPSVPFFPYSPYLFFSPSLSFSLLPIVAS